MCRKEYDIEEIGLGNFAPLITGKIQVIEEKNGIMYKNISKCVDVVLCVCSVL